MNIDLVSNIVPYNKIARFYDKMMDERNYEKWEKIIRNVVKKYEIQPGNCLDLACGTGNISIILDSIGFNVYGLDRSSSMLEIAREKLPSCCFIEADLRSFNLSVSDIVFAVSFYDSINYILNELELAETFKAIHNNLSLGSILLFDMNTKHRFGVAQNFKPRIYDEKDFYGICRFGGSDDYWTLDFNLFIRKGELYSLVRERHIERAYEKENIALLLSDNGFEVMEIIDDYEKYKDGQERISRNYFVAKKIDIKY